MKPVYRGTAALALVVALGGCGIFRKSEPKSAVLGQRIAVLANENAIEVDPALAAVPLNLPAPVINDSWSQSGGNANKAAGHVALGATLTPAWEARIAGGDKQTRLAAAPIVAGGRLYVVDTAANVHAFDANSGAKLWTVAFGNAGSTKETRALFGGGVSIEGDTLYVTNGIGDVGALKATDGSSVWKKSLGTPLRGAPSVALGTVYTVSQDNQLFALNATDGATQWTSAAAVQLAGVFGSASPAVAQGTVVAGFSSGDLNAYRYENGRTLWQDALSRTSINTSVGTLSDIDADPVIDEGRVFAVGAGGRMVALELVTGQRVWELNIAGISTPAVSGEWLFVVTDDARLLCVSRATGKVRWVSQLRKFRGEKASSGQVTWNGPVLAGGRLVLVSSEGDLAQVSPEDGKLQSSTDLKSGTYLSPVVANNTLYVLLGDGRLLAYR